MLSQVLFLFGLWRRWFVPVFKATFFLAGNFSNQGRFKVCFRTDLRCLEVVCFLQMRRQFHQPSRHLALGADAVCLRLFGRLVSTSDFLRAFRLQWCHCHWCGHRFRQDVSHGSLANQQHHVTSATFGLEQPRRNLLKALLRMSASQALNTGFGSARDLWHVSLDQPESTRMSIIFVSCFFPQCHLTGHGLHHELSSLQPRPCWLTGGGGRSS